MKRAKKKIAKKPLRRRPGPPAIRVTKAQLAINPYVANALEIQRRGAREPKSAPEQMSLGL
jgi:hypothetical protein